MPSLSAIKNKIIQSFAKTLMSDDDDLKTHLTKLILIHIRSLPLSLNQKERVESNCDKILIDQLCKHFLKEKEIFII